MAFTKTAVSIESGTFEAGEELARELHISRSQLYTRALKTLLCQRKLEAMRDRVNTVMASLTDEERAEEVAALEGIRRAAADTIRLTGERDDT